MNHHLSGVDHVLVGVRDLERARAAFERLGFATTPRGRHAGRGTGNYCLMFPEDYVELLGVVEPAAGAGAGGGLERFLAERGEGLFGVALRSIDAAATRAAWRAAGLGPSEVERFARMIEDAGEGAGGAELRFENVMLDPSVTAGLRVFACAHLTPEPMRRPEWLAHPNGAIGIGSVTVVADEPDALAPTLAKLVGPASVTDTDDTLAVHTGRGVILVTTPDDFELIHPALTAAAEEAGAEPRLGALTLLVEDPDRTAAYLDERGVPYEREHGGMIGIAPEQAHGVMLEFAPARAFGDRSAAA